MPGKQTKKDTGIKCRNNRQRKERAILKEIDTSRLRDEEISKITKQKRQESHETKKGEAVPHPECFHNGIILIVYVIQKSSTKVLLFFEIYKYFADILA